ncbi:MAG TPA: hydrolase 2, exosortase A system-associated [Casimicrobiaceae bacterium]
MVYPDAFFLPLRRGRRFCIRYVPDAAPQRRGAILYVHPFAEEMNKSRRMVALQARALAGVGWTVLQMDLFGCGDSEGDFGEAGWEQWVADVIDASAWLRQQTGRMPALWGLRAGCLVACQAAARMTPTPELCLWQPATSGKQSLQQFLRLKVTNQVLAGAAPDRTDTQALRERLAQGESLEIAGYMLSPSLASGLEAAELLPPKASTGIAWLEVAASTPAELSPAAQARLESWRAAGHRVDAVAVPGAAFWQTLEITECPALVEATLTAIAQWQT